jgi:hypothetical protein
MDKSTILDRAVERATGIPADTLRMMLLEEIRKLVGKRCVIKTSMPRLLTHEEVVKEFDDAMKKC